MAALDIETWKYKLRPSDVLMLKAYLASVPTENLPRLPLPTLARLSEARGSNLSAKERGIIGDLLGDSAVS